MQTIKALNPKHLQTVLLNWFDRHGRHDLPWQQQPTPYSIWVSEIMLQQTQVKTVVPYYSRFMQHFPNIATLAQAEIDEVLHVWTGLGYYSRARNLYKSAQSIMSQHAGDFPTDFDSIIALPGIGRSTAGAILAQALHQSYPILDGNVKRVLTRLHGIKGWPGDTKVNQALWQLASLYTPKQRVADYTQAIMDLGAMICKRKQPACTSCPLQSDCQADAHQLQDQLPTPKLRKPLPQRSTHMMLLFNQAGHVLLEQQSTPGLWGGLWSAPQCPNERDLTQWCMQKWQYHVVDMESMQPLKHTFTHFKLTIHPIRAITRDMPTSKPLEKCYQWYNLQQPSKIGLPKPVQQLLNQCKDMLNA